MERRPGLPHPVSTLALVAALLVATLVVTWGWGELEGPQPQQGVFDLRGWNQKPLTLGGTWAFDPGRWVGSQDFGRDGVLIRQVPDTRFTYPGGGLVADGSGTYRLRLTLPPVEGLGLRYSTVWTSFEVEVNGRVIVPPARAGILALEAADVATGQAEVLVRVANEGYRWGGIIRPFVLGRVSDLAAQKAWDDGLLVLVIGALLGLAINAAFLFAFRRDPVYPAFALFALSAVFRSLTSGDALLWVLLPGLDFETFVRIQYTSFYLMMPAGALFFYRLYLEDIGVRELAWFLVPHAVFLSLVPWAPLLVLSWSLVPYVPVALGLLVYGYYLACLRPTLRGRPGALTDLVAGTVLFAAVLANMHHEVLDARAETALPWGMALFVLVQSLVMGQRFTWAFDRAEGLSTELKTSYQALMLEARAAEEARDQLQALVAEKDVLLKEVHHRVKNHLQVISSIINLQSRRSKDPAVVAAYAAVRDRIRALATIHERLYGLNAESRIPVDGYLADLVDQFERSYPGEARFCLEVDPLEVSLDFCSDLGLIVTELVLNAYRHGSGDITLGLRVRDDFLVLTVADQGPGFPPGFDPRGADTVGYKIVTNLAAHRGGAVVVNQGPRARVEVTLAPWAGGGR